MIDFEYDVLCYIRSQQTPLWSDVLNAFDPSKNINITDAILRAELKNGIIEKTSKTDNPPLCRIRLSPEGSVALSAEKQRREKQALIREENIRRKQEHEQKALEQAAAETADRKAEKRADRAFEIFLAFLNALLPFLAGLLIEHFTGLIDLVSSLFQSHP